MVFYYPYILAPNRRKGGKSAYRLRDMPIRDGGERTYVSVLFLSPAHSVEKHAGPHGTTLLFSHFTQGRNKHARSRLFEREGGRRFI